MDGPVPALRLWGIRRSIILAVVAALLLVGAMVAAALWYAGWPSIKRDATVTPGTLFDLLKLVFAVVAGIGGVAALVVAYRRQRVAEHTSALAEFAHQLAHAADLRAEAARALAEAADERAKIETDRNGVRLFNERFAKASEQLGSDKAAVRLAGVYAMAGLADDWPQGRQTCIDVLCAYLRMPYVPPPEIGDEQARPATAETREEVGQPTLAAREEREVRHTVVRVIGAHLRLPEEDPFSWCGHDFDFTGAVFDGGDFSRARFSGGRVSFYGANFATGWVDFRDAEFSGALVSFTRATFSGARVSFERLSLTAGHVSFFAAKFLGGEVNFDEAVFDTWDYVSFIMAKFTAGTVSFKEAKFTKGPVQFELAEIGGARLAFDAAEFRLGSQVSFLGAKLSSGELSFERVRFTDGGLVVLTGADLAVPPKFTPEADGRPPKGLIFGQSSDVSDMGRRAACEE